MKPGKVKLNTREEQMRILLTGMLLALLTMISTSWAEMYRWVDEKGVMTFKDYPPPASKKRRVKVYSDSDFDSAPPQQSAPAPAKRSTKQSDTQASQPTDPKKERFNGTVEMYMTEWCGYCKKAAAYMKSRNIPFVAYDIEKDSSAQKRHAELGGRGVPLLVIGDKKMSGFSAEILEQYLGNR
jgi:glutaredoxin-like YruB-family protein